MRASAATPEENLGVDIGSVLLGKYRVDSIVGQGGMGVVARATNLHLNETVAIKFLRADVAGDNEATQRFLREAQAAFKLKGEHVARVLDVGQTDDEIPFLVMEFLDGVDLDGMLEQSARVAPQLSVDFIIQACEGLAEAHALGIVHRDVKPSNFFVTWRADGTPLVKLLDFGISKVANNTDVSLTQTQSMLGTPAYMSPEQMRSARTVDQRSDIWSLGAVLYELCEGTRPFEAESFSEMCVKVAVDPPATMTVPMPPGLEAIIVRCLEKKPDARYPNVKEVAIALAPYARDPRAAQASVDRIDRLLGRGSTPQVVHDAKSAPIAVASRSPAGHTPLPGPLPGPTPLGSSPTLPLAIGASGVMPPPPARLPTLETPTTASPAPIPLHPSGPHAQPSGEYDPYAPKKTVPQWASGSALPARGASGHATPATQAPSASSPWMTPPSSPSLLPIDPKAAAVTIQGPAATPTDPLADTLKEKVAIERRTTGSLRTPRRVATIAVVAVLCVVAAMFAVGFLGGGDDAAKLPQPSPSQPATEPGAATDPGTGSVTDPGPGSVTDSGSGSGSGSVTGSGSGSVTDPGSGSGSVTGTGTGTGSGARTGVTIPGSLDVGIGSGGSSTPGVGVTVGAGSGSAATVGAGSGSAKPGVIKRGDGRRGHGKRGDGKRGDGKRTNDDDIFGNRK